MKLFQAQRIRPWQAAAVLVCAAGLLPAALGAPAAPAEQPPGAIAIKDARIVTVSGPTFEKATVVIRNGLIESAGANTAIPADALVIDGGGLTVYPGLFDALTDLGAEEPAPAGPATARTGPAGPAAAAPQERPTMLAHLRVSDGLNSGGSRLESARNAGITTALSAPRRGIFAGQSAVINLYGETPAGMVVRTPVALHLLMESGGGFGGGYPGSLMGMIAFIRQNFLDADHYLKAQAAYNAQKRGTSRPTYNRSLEALEPFLRGQSPVILTANAAHEIERAVALAESLKVKYILSGVQQGYKVLPLLKERNVPLLVSLRFPEKERDADPEADESLRELQFRAEAPGNAAALYRAGIKIAFHSGQMTLARDFIRNAARAIQAGLPKEAALRAMTLNPAEIFGVAEQLGSIEKGKIANLVVATGDLFAEKTQLKYVFVDGRKFEVKPEEPPRREESGRPSTGAPTAPASPLNIAGNWNLVLESPQGALPVLASIRQQGEQLSGTLNSSMGQADIVSGSLKGREVRFKISFDMGGNRLEVEFVGTVEGNVMSGTASSVAFGGMPFAGTKSPGEEAKNI